MTNYIDSFIVGCYFFIVFVAGYRISRRYKMGDAHEFITGGKTMNWFRTGLTVLAMGYDPGIIAHAGLGFVWGLYPMQWLGTTIWFTAWFCALFLVPIYWRSKISTTPELLEKRFNVQSRAFFAIIMMSILIVTLSFGVYLGALLLKSFLGWSFWMSISLICAVAAFYVIKGGMRTVLAIDFWQAIFLLAAQFVIGGLAFWKLGCFSGLASIRLIGKAGTDFVSTIPPIEWDLFTETFYPLQAILSYQLLSGLAWLGISYAMVQRLLAARSEKDAQKALFVFAGIAPLACLPGYLVGIYMRTQMPDMLPDQAYPEFLLSMFPVGMKGLLVAGLMAALLSSIDGMFTATGALFTEDIYLRFIRPAANSNELKSVTRIIQGLCVIITVMVIPFIMKDSTALEFLQKFYGDVLGVISAVYISGIFWKRCTPRAAFIGMVTGMALSIWLDVFTAINFAYVGVFSFLYTCSSIIILSYFEKPLPEEKLVNLTVHTLEDAKGPWVGLKSWPDLWKWAVVMSAIWFLGSGVWEWYVRLYR
ncbi:MAG: sodium/solute symporter [Candidatus Latescibacteria bacterium]|nr:sodium/solute symporter [Candidatus Latescibacterota bacterium]